MRKLLAVSAIVLMIAIVCMTSQDVDADSSSVRYDPISGNLYIQFDSLGHNGEAALITISSESYETSKECTIQNGKIVETVNVGMLKQAIYNVILQGNSLSVKTTFKVDPFVSYDVTYDDNSHTLRYSGTTNLDHLQARIVGDGYSSEEIIIQSQDNEFSGSIDAGIIETGVYKLCLYYRQYIWDESFEVNIPDYVKINDVVYNQLDETLMWSGDSSVDLLWVKLVDSNEKIVFSTYSVIKNGQFNGQYNLKLDAGSYRLEILDSNDDAIGDSKIIRTTNVILSSDSDRSLSVYVGEYVDVKIKVVNGSDSDVSVQIGDKQIATASNLFDSGTMRIYGQSAGKTIVTAYSGQSEVSFEVNVSVKDLPLTQNDYSFNIRIEFYTNKLNLGQSGYDLNALKKGITLTATGKDAGSALEKALKQNKIPCSFFSGSSEGESLQHWVNHIFGMGDIHFDNGVWMYWIQYHNGSYNDKTLGYYKEGGSFELVYGMTAGDNSSAQRIQAVEIPQVKQTWTGRDITGLSNTSAYTVVSGGTGKDVGNYTAILRLNNGYAWEDATFTDKSVRWTIEKQVSESSTTNADGSVTKKSEEKDENGSTLTETTTKTKKDPSGTTTETKDVKVTTKDTSGKVTGMSEVKEETVKDKAGNVTHHSTVETSMDKDGNVLSSREEVKDYSKDKDDAGNDVSVETISTVSKDKDGNVIENKEVSTATKSVTDEDGSVSDVRTVTETEKDAEGNVKGSTEKSETKDSDGNITEKSEVLRDKDGNETYSKVEEIVPTKVTEEEGKTVTESSTKVTEKESGKTTVTEESVKETVGADGAKETEKVREESVTDSNGSTSSKKVTEKVVEDGESKLTSTQTESKDASGKETSEKKVEAESKDGSVKSSVEVPQDGSNAEIVTVLGSGQSGGVMSISSDQVKLAVSLQEKVSGEITDVQQEKVMLAESTTDSISLTLSGEAMKGMSDSGAALNIVSSEGSLKVSKEVLENLSGEGDVVIQFSASEDISLSEDQKDAIGENASVLEIKVMSDGESLGSSINGTLTLLVKHVAAEGMVPTMYYVADNGDMEKLEGSYDAERQEMTGITTHCSIYAVIDEDPNAGGDDVLIFAAAAAITILAVAAVAGYLYMRRS